MKVLLRYVSCCTHHTKHRCFDMKQKYICVLNHKPKHSYTTGYLETSCTNDDSTRHICRWESTVEIILIWRKSRWPVITHLPVPSPIAIQTILKIKENTILKLFCMLLWNCWAEHLEQKRTSNCLTAAFNTQFFDHSCHLKSFPWKTCQRQFDVYILLLHFLYEVTVIEVYTNIWK